MSQDFDAIASGCLAHRNYNAASCYRINMWPCPVEMTCLDDYILLFMIGNQPSIQKRPAGAEQYKQRYADYQLIKKSHNMVGRAPRNAKPPSGVQSDARAMGTASGISALGCKLTVLSEVCQAPPAYATHLCIPKEAGIRNLTGWPVNLPCGFCIQVTHQCIHVSIPMGAVSVPE